MRRLGTIHDTIELAFVLIKSKGRGKEGYKCKVTKGMVEYLALHAFKNVLGKKQSAFGEVIAWLDEKVTGLEGKGKGMDVEMGRMRGVVEG